MRIGAGKHRGRPLQAPAGQTTRPTGARARDALFNILAHSERVDLDGARVVDCFAGSGALGLEALSRGAAHVTFIDADPHAVAAIRANVAALGETAAAAILRADTARLPAPTAPCTLALLDAPYNQDLTAPALAALAAGGWLAAGALAVAEVAAREDFTPPPGFDVVDQRVYGAARLIFVVYRA